jgi:low affinity Fe/Cu permease
MRFSFSHLARIVADLLGTPVAFFVAVAIVLAWAVAGPLFHFSDTWQLLVNTGTIIATFLNVFLIQNTQNRDAKDVASQARRGHSQHAQSAQQSHRSRELH